MAEGGVWWEVPMVASGRAEWWGLGPARHPAHLPRRDSACVCGPGQDDRAWHVAGGSLARSWWMEAVGVEGPGPRPPVPTTHGLHTMGTGFFVPHYL